MLTKPQLKKLQARVDSIAAIATLRCQSDELPISRPNIPMSLLSHFAHSATDVDVPVPHVSQILAAASIDREPHTGFLNCRDWQRQDTRQSLTRLAVISSIWLAFLALPRPRRKPDSRKPGPRKPGPRPFAVATDGTAVCTECHQPKDWQNGKGWVGRHCPDCRKAYHRAYQRNLRRLRPEQNREIQRQHYAQNSTEILSRRKRRRDAQRNGE